MSKEMKYFRWVIWALAIAFYFYEYFIRVAPGVMTEDLFRSFNIGASVFGVISAAYLYAYAPMQIPVGILMDRYGARKLLTIATLGCGIAALLFGLAPKVWIAIVARIIMGAGSAFAFIGMIYITSHWFHGKMLALLVGLGNSIGMLGAVFGEGPLAALVKHFGWRMATVSLGIFGVVLGFVIFLIVRNDPPSMEKHTPKPKTHLLQSLKKTCKNKQTWINGVVAMMFYTATAAFGGLWAIPFFQQTYGFSNEMASFAASMIYIGWIVAGPIIGHLSDRSCNRKRWIFTSTLLSILFFCLIVYTPIHEPIWVFALMFLLGCTLSAQLLCYSLAIELNTPETKGAALAMTNFLVFVAGSLIQTIIGLIMDGNWQGKIIDGARIYSLATYQKALVAFPITMLLAFLLTFLIKEASKPWCKNR